MPDEEYEIEVDIRSFRMKLPKEIDPKDDVRILELVITEFRKKMENKMIGVEKYTVKEAEK